MPDLKKLRAGAVGLAALSVLLATLLFLVAYRDGVEAQVEPAVPQDFVSVADSLVEAKSSADEPRMAVQEDSAGEVDDGRISGTVRPACELSVLNSEGLPIEGAQVLDLGDLQVLGGTDSRGVLNQLRSLTGGSNLQVRAEGYAPGLVRVPDPVPTSIELRLDRAWTLKGRVVGPQGEAIGPGATVIALRPGESLSVARLKASLTGVGPIPVASTDSDGNYEFPELDPAMSYGFYAGGLGFCSADPFGPRVGSEFEAELNVITVKPVYGVLIIMREEGGRMPRLGPGLQGRWLGTPTALVDDARIVMSAGWTPLMLGLDPVDAPAGSTTDRSFYFATRADHGESVGLSFLASFPGYEETDVRVVAGRAVNSLSTRVVELEPRALGFGELTVWLEPVERPEAILPFAAGSACPELLLESLVGEQRIRVMLDDIIDGSQLVPGIPFGSYSVQFRASHQLFRFPKFGDGPVVVTIGEANVDFQVPLGGLGALEFRVFESDGLEFGGSISGTHMRDAGGETDAFYFPSPPYAIRLLPRGDYTLSVFAAGVELKGSFVIHEGELSQLELSISD